MHDYTGEYPHVTGNRDTDHKPCPGPATVGTPMTGTDLGEATRQRIGDLYLGGAEVDEVARQVERAPDEIAEVLTELGIPHRPPKSTLDIEAVVAMYEGGESMRGTAVHFHRAYGTIHRIIAEHSTLRGPHKSTLDVEAVVAMYDGGASIRGVAHHFHKGYGTIHRIIAEHSTPRGRGAPGSTRPT